LIAVYEEIRRRFRRSHEPHPVLRVLMFFGGIVLSTVIASVAVAPFAAYHFHQSQQYAVIANLLAIPICNFIVMPAALAALVLMPFGLEAAALYPMGLGIEAMKWCADLVAAIPGAVGHIAAMPVFAFALMIVGGLWIALWQTRMRLAGAAAVLAGVLAAPGLPRPDLLIGRGGEIVAVRDRAGRLSALPARSARFEIARWLEHDGDGRTARDAEKADAFTCDAAGCIATVKGHRIAVARRPAAVNDDCALADILVLPTPRPKSCPHPELVVDVFDVWRKGAHAVYLTGDRTADGKGFHVETVAAERGNRPWSTEAAARRERRPSAALPKPAVVPDASPNAGSSARHEKRAAAGPPGGSADESDADLGLVIPEADAETDGE
jgi:competence protein ComEC